MIIQNNEPLNDNFEDRLTYLGLTHSEARIYLAALELGTSSVIQLAAKAYLSRQMVYLLLPKLQHRGLIQQLQQGNKVIYKALSPKLLKGLMKQAEKEITDMIPLLESKQAEHQAIPNLIVYENPVSMREWYLRFMQKAKEGDEILIYSSGQLWHWFDLDPKFYARYLAFCDRKKIASRIILPNTAEARLYQKKLGSPSRKPRYSADLSGEIVEKWIWRNQVCFQTLREQATNLVVMESDAIADLERRTFNKVWETSRK